MNIQLNNVSQKESRYRSQLATKMISFLQVTTDILFVVTGSTEFNLKIYMVMMYNKYISNWTFFGRQLYSYK